MPRSITAAMRYHPRSRGVYASSLRSSPPSPGIIPARAGFTHPPPPPRHPHRDHPRSRGVYDGLDPVPEDLCGSSPLARGLQYEDPFNDDRMRIIPARAGFTPRRCSSPPSTPDHPRSRGVYTRLWAAADTMRGIIPARAGFTARRYTPGRPCPDHPRSRGVYSCWSTSPSAASGSSPLARGLRVTMGGAEFTVRIIPARAGFTA